MEEDDTARKYFSEDATDRDRAVFEAGVKLGAVYHQFIGTPIPRRRSDVAALEKAIEKCIITQPWVKNVKVNIKAAGGGGVYGYYEISENNIEAMIEVKYNRVEVKARLKYITELKYPLAYIEEIRV